MSESKTATGVEIDQFLGELEQRAADIDIDASETQEWLSSLDYVLKSKGPDRVRFLIEQLRDRAASEGIQSAEDTSTPYINTIPLQDQPLFRETANSNVELNRSCVGMRWLWSSVPTRGEGEWADTSVRLRPAQPCMKSLATTFLEVVERADTQVTPFSFRATPLRACTAEPISKAD